MLAKNIWQALSGKTRRAANETQLGPYTLQRKLGQGGMGVVFEARHSLLRRRAAVKMLPAERAGDEAYARFEREVQVTAQLSHPNIVQVYDYGRTDEGSFYYAMEYLDGVDLERLVHEHGPLPAARVAHILLQAAEALAEAHAAGVIHRDIKPANLVLCNHPRRPDLLKVVDFGLVKDLRQSDPAVTDINVISGTPLYMAPETVTAPDAVDGRADLYALGAVAYFLLTGNPPFTGKNVIEVMGQHLHATVTPPSELCAVPSDLEAILLACLAKDPADRPQSAAELVDRLEGCRDAASWKRAEARAWWAERAA
jgi:serine/threonine protein kinase